MNARNLIKLENEGGTDLLLFCVRAGRLRRLYGESRHLVRNEVIRKYTYDRPVDGWRLGKGNDGWLRFMRGLKELGPLP